MSTTSSDLHVQPTSEIPPEQEMIKNTSVYVICYCWKGFSPNTQVIVVSVYVVLLERKPGMCDFPPTPKSLLSHIKLCVIFMFAKVHFTCLIIFICLNKNVILDYIENFYVTVILLCRDFQFHGENQPRFSSFPPLPHHCSILVAYVIVQRYFL